MRLTVVFIPDKYSRFHSFLLPVNIFSIDQTDLLPLVFNNKIQVFVVTDRMEPFLLHFPGDMLPVNHVFRYAGVISPLSNQFNILFPEAKPQIKKILIREFNIQ